MGFPGLLNTLGTLLDRSQTITHIFNKSKKCLSACLKTPVVRPGVHYKICFTDFGRPAKIKMRIYAKIDVFMYMFEILANIDLN